MEYGRREMRNADGASAAFWGENRIVPRPDEQAGETGMDGGLAVRV